MILKSLTLRQFRSHSQLELTVKSGVNVFVGPNGSGKTNILEALAVLATGFSPRGSEISDMAQWGTNGFAIVGTFLHAETEQELTLEMKYKIGAQRSVQQNGETTIRLRDLLGKVPLVSFVPEDLAMVKGEPDLRRQAINLILAQVEPNYADTLRRYNDIVKARNAALKQVADGQLRSSDVSPWDASLVESGLYLCRKRHQFFREFSPMVETIHARLSDQQEQLQMVYEPSFDEPWSEDAADRWLQQLERQRAQEVAIGVTLSGPHRDNMAFVLNGRPAKSHASEGQKRTCAVSFKLAEIPFIQRKLGQKPICLLDDVLSELDAHRAQHLLDELSQTGQSFVTMTGLESWPQDRPVPATLFQVAQGRVFCDAPIESKILAGQL